MLFCYILQRVTGWDGSRLVLGNGSATITFGRAALPRKLPVVRAFPGAFFNT